MPQHASSGPRATHGHSFKGGGGGATPGLPHLAAALLVQRAAPTTLHERHERGPGQSRTNDKGREVCRYCMVRAFGDAMGGEALGGRGHQPSAACWARAPFRRARRIMAAPSSGQSPVRQQRREGSNCKLGMHARIRTRVLCKKRRSGVRVVRTPELRPGATYGFQDDALNHNRMSTARSADRTYEDDAKSQFNLQSRNSATWSNMRDCQIDRSIVEYSTVCIPVVIVNAQYMYS